MPTPYIIDDGTMDTVFGFRGREYRFDSEYIAECGGPDAFLKDQGQEQIIDEWYQTVPEEYSKIISRVDTVGTHSESMDGYVSIKVAHIDQEKFETIANTTYEIFQSEANNAEVSCLRADDILHAIEEWVSPGFDNTTHDCCGNAFSYRGRAIHIDDIYARITIEQRVIYNV